MTRRLDDHRTEGIAIAHRNVMPRHRDILDDFIPEGVPVNYFINYDPEPSTASALEEEISLQELAHALDDLVDKVDHWLKNHPRPSSARMLS